MIWQPGMAFHGGIIGVILATYFFCKARKIKILELFDLISVGTPIGLFFGRLANFINGELWGRVTDSPLGMVFPGAGPYPRHPSQLYEALLEGVFLLILQASLLILAKKKQWGPGLVGGAFGVSYAVTRGFAEFFREPEDGFVGPFTAGQFLSLPLIFFGILLIRNGLKKKQKGA